jgi:thymidylate kinase
MIVIIEGAQGSGKTHLIKSLQERLVANGREDIIFYKYQHVDHLKKLDINNIEPTEAFHYFTISNTLTMLELQETVMKDKILVYDRGIFSAYVWSILRNRLGEENNIKLYNELEKFLKLGIYRNCHIIRIKPIFQMKRDHSDIFDEFKDPGKENSIFDSIFKKNIKLIDNLGRNNSYTEVNNHLDKLSEAMLYRVFNEIIS